MRTRQLVLLFSAVFLLGITVARLPATISVLRGKDDWETALQEIHALISDRFYREPKQDELYKGAIEGMVRALDDQFTEFVPPADSALFEKELTGQFVGIGATIAIEDGVLTIVSPLEDSPALKAGILPGDKVITIDGKPTRDILSTQDAVKILTGKPGTSVVLGIERESKPMEITIPRGEITAKVAHGLAWKNAAGAWDWAVDPARRIAYIQLTQFSPTIADDLREAIEAATKQLGGPPKGLILDLRDNPGGVLEEATEIADMFLDAGTIVSTKGRAHREHITKAEKGQILPDVALAILINGNSASASEILAGSLADNNRAVIIGTRSYGKGVVQSLEEIRSLPGGLLKLTEQNYYLPSGRMIQRVPDAETWGVDPTDGFHVAATDADRRASFEIHRELDAIRPAGSKAPWKIGAPKWDNPQWLSTVLHDPQLAAAVAAVQIRLDTGKWTPTGDPLPKNVAAAKSASKELDSLERLRTRLEQEITRVDKRLDELSADHTRTQAKALESLWSDKVDVSGGKVEVFDKSGKRIATLDITGPDLERWLLEADIKPRPPADAPAATPTTPTTDAKPPTPEAPK